MSGDDAGRRAAADNYIDIQHHADPAALAQRLGDWLRARLPDGADPEIRNFDASSANGLSSDTVLFDATWHDADGIHDEPMVARIAPEPHAAAVFADYDLTGQYATISTVAARTDVPVPKLWWCEDDAAVLGRPFFVMRRVDGLVPPDVLPYTFGDNWVFDAPVADRDRMQTAMIDTLAAVHAIADAPGLLPHLEPRGAGPTRLARQLDDVRGWYAWSRRTAPASTLVGAALERLTSTLPDEPGGTVLSWGDARIGNVLFDDFTPVGVLDWEMAALGPRELDLAWLTYSHTVFQDLATGLGAAGLPAFLTVDDVTRAYEATTGHAVTHFDWHLLFAATRWAIVFLRTAAREREVSGRELPDEGDEVLHNRPSLERFLDGDFRAR